MKFKSFPITLILLILVSINSISMAQNVVKYDFESKNPPEIPVAELGENSIFKIININKFLYEVKIETSQSEFNSEPPAVFSNIFQIEKKEESTIPKEVIDQTDADVAAKESAFSLASEKSSLEWNKLKLESLSEDLLEYKAVPDTLQDLDKITELNEKINSLKNEIENQNSTIQQLNDIIDDEYFGIISGVYSNAESVNESFEKLEEAKSIKNKLIQLSLTDGLTHKDAIIKLNAMKNDYPFMQKPEKLLTAFNSSYRNFKTNIQLYSINQVVLAHYKDDPKKVEESTKNLVTEVENIKKKVDTYNYDELFQNVNKLFSELKNESNYFIASDPIQAQKDIINYNVTITPRKGIESLSPLETRHFITEVPISGGVKIDFSTGLIVTSGLHNRSYSTSISPNDSTKSIISKNSNNNLGNLSLGALMHISRRTTDNFKLGGTLGLGLNTTDLNDASVFAGVSGMFGSQERFIISLGLAMAKVDYLKSEYSLDKEILTNQLSDDLTEKTTRIGAFISFSYNLTNKKKE
nr:hypothetical protein [uncultured Draconibacterium sp.]